MGNKDCYNIKSIDQIKIIFVQMQTIFTFGVFVFSCISITDDFKQINILTKYSNNTIIKGNGGCIQNRFKVFPKSRKFYFGYKTANLTAVLILAHCKSMPGNG